jgi:hypothetical protein
MHTTQERFNAAYWAAQPPEVRVLADITDPARRAAKAAELAHAGFRVDVPIMAWGWDPYTTMKERVQAGYTWVPSALQAPVPHAPTIGRLGERPIGAIVVSVFIEDYPAWNEDAAR